ncbi:hypothetical protein TNIN_217511 [Trichonephila inaurata madagascariensis]|uniref:Uncharacterized protein n=1 Tax=Trichonephila inaurata madagascariensis TaxID=2747483 RepID=A0A8X7CDW6_9ARAC|nr:hypothetical protein TNIN_217511 [Trichonephila inaurata madagascariensis]
MKSPCSHSFTNTSRSRGGKGDLRIRVIAKPGGKSVAKPRSFVPRMGKRSDDPVCYYSSDKFIVNPTRDLAMRAFFTNVGCFIFKTIKANEPLEDNFVLLQANKCIRFRFFHKRLFVQLF